MPKKFDDIVVPERKKSIRNIPVSDVRKRLGSELLAKKRMTKAVEEQQEEAIEVPIKRMPPPPRRVRGSGKKIFYPSLIALVILFFTLLSIFDGATFSYVPKSVGVTFNSEIFSATKTGENGLLYSVVKLSGDKGKTVSASGENEVSRKASGTIVVYNNTVTEQRLIENTRFESVAGKIYRIQKAIAIPAKKGTQPGSLEVVVYADIAGAEHNSGPTDFTVPGLVGTPRYTTIYARSKTSMSGGFVGKEKSVSEADTLKARSELRSSLTEELLAKAGAEVPEDFVLFPSLSSITFEDLPQTAGPDSGSATVNLRGHLFGIMFKRTELARELSRSKTVLGPNDSVDLDSLGNIKLSFSGTPPTDLLALSKINFKVEGAGKLVWKIDEVALKSDLLGRKKSEVSSILKNYPNIASDNISIRPFWKRSFPKEADKVMVKKIRSE